MPSINGERRQHYPTDDDREWLRQRMEHRKMSSAVLGKQVGMTRQAIRLILNGTTRGVWEWPAIVAAVGGTPPSGVPVILDDKLREIVRRWPDLSEKDREMVEQLAKRLHRAKP